MQEDRKILARYRVAAGNWRFPFGSVDVRLQIFRDTPGAQRGGGTTKRVAPRRRGDTEKADQTQTQPQRTQRKSEGHPSARRLILRRTSGQARTATRPRNKGEQIMKICAEMENLEVSNTDQNHWAKFGDEGD